MGSGAAPRKLRFRHTATRHPRSIFRDGTRIPNTSRAPLREPQNLHTRLPHPRPPKNHCQPRPLLRGIPDRPPPAYLPTLLTRSPTLLRFYRLAISQYLIKWSLQTAFSLASLFFNGIFGHDLIGAHAAPWMHPDAWSSYAHASDRGLQGGEPVRVCGARKAPPARDRVYPLRLPCTPALATRSRARRGPCVGPSASSSYRLLALRRRRCWRASWALGRVCEGGCRWGRAAGEVDVCACVVLSYGAVAGGRFCEGQTVIVRAGPCQSAACAGARRQGRWVLVLRWTVGVSV